MDRETAHELLETAWAIIVSVTILTALGFLLLFCLATFTEGQTLDPDVYRDHVQRFGDFHYMSENELRRALRLVETEPGTEPLICLQIVTMTTWYNDPRFLYEIVEDFSRPKIKGPRR